MKLKGIASAVSAVLTAALLAFSFTPIAHASDSGELRWGIKRSFIDYVANIARGEVVAEGAGFSNFQARFSQAGQQLSAEGLGRVSYRGRITFTGHNQVLLSIQNPVIEIAGPSSARLFADFGAGSVHFVNLNLAAGLRSQTGSLISYREIPTSLTSAGADAFSNFYVSGEALDNIQFSIQLGEAVTEAAPNAQPAAPGATAESAPSAGGTAASGEPDASDEPTEETASETRPDELPVAVTTAAGELRDRSAELAELGEARVGCSADQFLSWSVKESFLAYLDSELAKGGWQTVSAIERVEGFDWPLASVRVVDADNFSVEAAGAIRFFGHAGALDVLIANPTLTQQGLFVDFFGESMTGEVTNKSQLALANISELSLSQNGESLTLRASLELTSAGADAFGFYAVGTELAPIELNLVAAADCVTLAAPDSNSQWLVWLALFAAAVASAVSWLWFSRRTSATGKSTKR